MANKRDLKKAIHQVTASLFTDCVLFKELIPAIDVAKTDLILDDILAFQEEFLSRVNCNIGKQNPKEIRVYFKNLTQDVVVEAQKIVEKINDSKQ